MPGFAADLVVAISEAPDNGGESRKQEGSRRQGNPELGLWVRRPLLGCNGLTGLMHTVAVNGLLCLARPAEESAAQRTATDRPPINCSPVSPARRHPRFHFQVQVRWDACEWHKAGATLNLHNREPLDRAQSDAFTHPLAPIIDCERPTERVEFLCARKVPPTDCDRHGTESQRNRARRTSGSESEWEKIPSHSVD